MDNEKTKNKFCGHKPKKGIGRGKAIQHTGPGPAETIIPLPGLKSKFSKFKTGEVRKDENEEDCSVSDELNKGHRDGCIPLNVLVRGKSILPFFQELENFPFSPLVAKTLQKDMQFEKPNQLQRCAWPHVLRGRNCFIVGGKTSRKGKSLSYIVPIAAQLIHKYEKGILNEKQESNIEKYPEYGPIGLFICSSQSSGEKLHGHFDKLLKGTKIQALLILAEDRVKQNLNKNPEFVITTPDFLLNLLKNHCSVFGFDRLRHIVFDDAHVILKNKYEAVLNIIDQLAGYLERLKNTEFPLQTIFCGQKWSPIMKEAFLNLTDEPVLLMSSSLQAIVFGGIKVHVHFCSEEEKWLKLIDLIDRELTTRTLIVCQNRSTVEQLGHKLYRNLEVKVEFIPAGDQHDTSDQAKGIENSWFRSKPTERIYFICLDEELKLIDFQGVQSIVHFEMPSNKSDAFGDRHIPMWKHFPDISDTPEEKVDVKLVSHVFLTPDEPDLYKIVRNFREINITIPDDLNRLTENDDYEMMNKTPMCKSIQHFGFCKAIEELGCDYRHFFNKEEVLAEPTVPKIGRVEIEVLKCHSVNTFEAKLHHYYEFKNGKKERYMSFLNILRKREEELTNYYSKAANRIPLKNFAETVICALESGEDNGFRYTRGQITIISKESEDGFPLEVRLYCIDAGHYVIRNVNKIYELPEEFKSQRPMTVNVILANLKPNLGDEGQFLSCQNMKIRKKTETKIYTAQIALSIGNTIWVKPMIEHEHDSTGALFQRSNLRIDIIKKCRVAEDNPDHLENLYSLCESAGLNCHVYRGVEIVGPCFEATFYMNREPMNWAYLKTQSMNKPQTVEVWSTFVESPDLIYVNLNKFVDLMDSLNTEMELHILSLIEGNYADYASRFSNYYEEGICVAAMERYDQVWNRALITNVYEDKDSEAGAGGKVYDVFFVDHGDRQLGTKLFELFPIPKKYVKQLPFQAIAIQLNHIHQGKDSGMTDERPEWSDDVGKALRRKLFMEGKSTAFEVMALEKLSKQNRSEPPCEYYESFAFVEDKELGEYLVEEKHAFFHSGMEDLVDQIKRNLLENLSKLVISNLASDDEEDEQANPGVPNFEDFDVYIGQGDSGFINQLLPQLGNKINGTSKLPDLKHDEPVPSSSRAIQTQSATISSSSTSTSSLSLTGGASVTQVQNNDPQVLILCPPNSSNSPGTSNNSTNGLSNGSESDVVLKKKPFVQWTETGPSITLRICIPDLKKYTLKIGEDKRHLSFVSEEPPNFAFDFNLLGKIRLPVKEELLGQYLLIRMTKLTEETRWKTITRDKTNCWWLKQDLSNLSSEDDSDREDVDPWRDHTSCLKATKIQENKTERKANGLDMELTPIDYGRDVSDSDSLSSDSDVSDDASQDTNMFKTRQSRENV